MKDSKKTGKKVINNVLNATGTKESIVQWGKIDKLDINQQIAFEILAATNVLTFHKDATDNNVSSETPLLIQLTRRH